MRLFIAVNFEEPVKDQIFGIIREVEKYALKGRFAKKEHMHLTLEFLGEIPQEKIISIISAMNCIGVPPFTLEMAGLGYFRRRGGDICWLCVKENKKLMEMQSRLHKTLLDKGFLLQDREYRPHITIGREVKLKESFNSLRLEKDICSIIIHVISIELMKSERINGRLVHQRIFSKVL